LDHLEASKVPPHAFQTNDLTYMAAYKKATAAAVPDKGERSDRDPRVRGGLPAVLPPRRRPYAARASSLRAALIAPFPTPASAR
jgi:hypothetical protein